MMARGRGFGILAAAALCFAVGCADDGGTTETDNNGDGSAAVYSRNCAGCHGADGGGVGNFPALTDTVPGLAVGDIETAVRDGVGDGMPGFTAAQISDDELTALANWVIGEFGGG